MSCVLNHHARETIEGDWKDCVHTSLDEDAHKKRLVICCDGTWNNANSSDGKPTNVSRLATVLAQKCCTGMPQVVYYHRGAGTEKSKAGKVLGGMLGLGVIEDVADVYRFVCDNYSTGDEIFFVGFSRGAFTARSVAAMVCSLGLLNGFGLANFGAIFNDYQDFSNWTPDTVFDKDKHLKGFNIDNFIHLANELLEGDLGHGHLKKYGYYGGADNATVEGWITELKEDWYDEMKKLKDDENGSKLDHMADVYKDKLELFRMISCTTGGIEGMIEKVLWKPEDIKVKAVAVWDTVGSLGVPKASWVSEQLRPGRSAEELRFASLYVHKNVENAFHALALDEWRTAFKPTMWGKMDNQPDTHLRQVWFPGAHSDVGGGGQDQQIATISLAWMADQLSSIGVEFVPEEMRRLFRTVDFVTEPSKWGLGQISAPPITTSILDRVHDGAMYPYKAIRGQNLHVGTRTPGNHLDDHDAVLNNTNELIHPCVRIRYLYGGKDVDNVSRWECAALTSSQNGYRLKQSAGSRPPVERRPSFATKQPEADTSPYKTLAGDITCVHAHDDTADKANKVPKQLPFETRLLLPDASSKWAWETPRQPPFWNEADDIEDIRSVPRWVWERVDPKTNEVLKTLHEERIGMWERLFLKTNKEHIDLEARRKATGTDEDNKKTYSNFQTKTNFRKRMSDLRKRVTSRATAAVTAPFKVVGMVGQAATGTIGRMLMVFAPYSERPKLGKRYVDYGYHDFISWQYGDLRKYKKHGNTQPEVKWLK